METPIGQRPFRAHRDGDPRSEERVQAAGQHLLAVGLVEGGSALTPGTALWTADNTEALRALVVDSPVPPHPKFEDKLRAVLDRSSDTLVQLAAEQLLIWMLPLNDWDGAKKRLRFQQAVDSRMTNLELAAVVDEALDRGIFNGGMGYTVQAWKNWGIQVTIAAAWTSLPPDERAQLSQDPWSFRDFVESVPGAKPAAQRYSLRYLAFPDVFEPVVNHDHRRRIQKHFRDRLPRLSSDLDRDLSQIRDALEAEAGGAISWYRPPFDGWRKAAAPPVPVAHRRSWWVRLSDRPSEDETGWVALDAGRLEAAPSATHPVPQVLAAAHPDLPASQVHEGQVAWSSFLQSMTPGDLVTTSVEEALHVGEVAGEIAFIPADPADDSAGARLQREVVWQDVLDLTALPSSMTTRLSLGLEVVELTPAERALMEATADAAAPGPLLTDPTLAFADELLVQREWLQECVDLLRDKPQLILYGPPGTGKTYLAQRLAWHLGGRERTTLVQFHPSYTYEDFFEGYRPRLTADGALAFDLHAGPFRRVVDRARRDTGNPYFLIVDEINRGNLAKVFGELYFLLEYRHEAVELLYSREDDRTFTLPDNVFVIGTMNTVDRSIALVDTAMRRRFAFVSLHPSVEPTRSLLGRWLQRKGFGPEHARLLNVLNQTIADGDLAIGPSYFMREAVHRPGGLERMWRTAILPLLEEYHYEQGPGALAQYQLPALLTKASAAEAGVASGPGSGALSPGSAKDGEDLSPSAGSDEAPSP